MAEAKNSFLKGKMNKDLDNRILPNGEYRDALNISVGKSEDQSVGSLQNVLGNSQLRKSTSTGSEPFESNTNLVCIGSFVDNENNRVYQFLTDYQDPNPDLINLPTSDREMKITVYDPLNSGNPYVTLVSGLFLNFSITNLITGVNLLENLLFWTDNRNQPRKINIERAFSNPSNSSNPYYINADQISVAKYAPFTCPSLYTKSKDITTYFTGPVVVLAGQTYFQVAADTHGWELTVGDQLVCEGVGIEDSAIVTDVNFSGINYTVRVTGSYPLIPNLSPVTFYRCLMSRAPLSSTVNGNDNFLTDKFVRFSYRFKFDDNELSLMAPFTQPTFIPEQKGFFINGDESAAYRSTVLDWMQNDVNAVTLLIELPDIGSNIVNSYKIKSIDILYKESDSLAVKVVETINATTIATESPSTNLYSYKYVSQKPRKTLQEAETLRVYDKVPIRALSQENAGNRIVYGNFISQNTPPSTLDYNLTVIEKGVAGEDSSSWIEYPNHTLKQNRTYQAGIILSDKFGRQSSVILSSAEAYTLGGDVVYGASSLFLPYKNESWTTSVKNWVGDELAVIFNKTIDSTRDESIGTPGLYATISGFIDGSSTGFQVTATTFEETTEGTTIYSYYYTLADVPAQRNYPVEGNYLKGKYVDYVKVLTASEGFLTTEQPISDIYAYNIDNNPDVKYSYSINELGWYSYKIVVKQQEQEYYNVYIPGMLAGYPTYQTFATSPSQYSVFPTGENDTTCHFVSINDNINKIPRDLSEVGPNQKQYRSSAKIWGRVENTLVNPGNSITAYTTNRQYFPGPQPDTVSTIAPTTELNFLPNSSLINPEGSASFNLYQFETSPLINRVTTSKRVGVIGTNTNTPFPPSSYNSMSPFLGVYETTPINSALDIFWETSTTGYISDLNADVLTGSDSIISYTPLNFLYLENQDYNGSGNITGAINSPWITDWFYFRNGTGVGVYNIDNIVFSVFNRQGDNITSSFVLVQDLVISSPNYLKWRIKITQSDIYYGTNVDTYGSFIFNFLITHTVGTGPLATTYSPTITTSLELLKISNIIPSITYPIANSTPVYNLTSDPLIGPIVDMTGINGNIGTVGSNNLVDLYWDLSPYSSIDPSLVSVNYSTGDISVLTNSVPIGDTNVVVRLRDATTSAGLQSPDGMSAFRTVTLNVPDFRIGCGTWDSITYIDTSYSPLQYRNVTSGYINIWKMLRKNETIVTSNVWVEQWVELSTGIIHYLNQYEMPVVFTSGSPTNFNGVFSKQLFNSTSPTAFRAAVTLKFNGSIITSSGRTVTVNFYSTGVSFTPPPTGVYQEVNADTCVVGSPSGYVPTECREWKIYNNSSFPVPWSGLHGNGHQIVGGTIQPGQTIGSSAYGGTQPLVRRFSLQSAGTSTLGGIITYAGTATACPL